MKLKTPLGAVKPFVTYDDPSIMDGESSMLNFEQMEEVCFRVNHYRDLVGFVRNRMHHDPDRGIYKWATRILAEVGELHPDELAKYESAKPATPCPCTACSPLMRMR